MHTIAEKIAKVLGVARSEFSRVNQFRPEVGARVHIHTCRYIKCSSREKIFRCRDTKADISIGGHAPEEPFLTSSVEYERTNE